MGFLIWHVVSNFLYSESHHGAKDPNGHYRLFVYVILLVCLALLVCCANWLSAAYSYQDGMGISYDTDDPNLPIAITAEPINNGIPVAGEYTGCGSTG